MFVKLLFTGEKLMHHDIGAVAVDVLINPRLSTLRRAISSFLHPPLPSSLPRYRHLVYAGLAYAGSGSWLAQDGPFTFSHFKAAANRDAATLGTDKRPANGGHRKPVVAVSVFAEGEWTEGNLREVLGEKGEVEVRLNPGLGKRAELEASEEGIIK